MKNSRSNESLLTRGVYTPERLRAEGLRRTDPKEFNLQLEQGYVRNVDVDRPAVISINMQISSLAVTELLNRIHPFKDDKPSGYSRVMVDFCGSCMINDHEENFPVDLALAKFAGYGDCRPLLRMVELG